MNNKIILAATVGMLMISFLFLSALALNQSDINKLDIWSIYFIDPKSDSLDFAIENHSKTSDFHVEILTNKTSVLEENASVPLGETKTIPVSLNDLKDKKITITVTAGDNKKEIYKNF